MGFRFACRPMTSSYFVWIQNSPSPILIVLLMLESLYTLLLTIRDWRWLYVFISALTASWNASRYLYMIIIFTLSVCIFVCVSGCVKESLFVCVSVWERVCLCALEYFHGHLCGYVSMVYECVHYRNMK